MGILNMMGLLGSDSGWRVAKEGFEEVVVGYDSFGGAGHCLHLRRNQSVGTIQPLRFTMTSGPEIRISGVPSLGDLAGAADAKIYYGARNRFASLSDLSGWIVSMNAGYSTSEERNAMVLAFSTVHGLEQATVASAIVPPAAMLAHVAYGIREAKAVAIIPGAASACTMGIGLARGPEAPIRSRGIETIGHNV